MVDHPKEEKAVSTKVSTTINIAHNKLKNPISRAAYLVVRVVLILTVR